MKTPPQLAIAELTDRARDVFRNLVEAYLETGEPVGSRSLTRNISERVSAATVRNVMQDLELLGLLSAPHASAGRMPTTTGLRMFVDGLLEVDNLATSERKSIENSMSQSDDLTTKLDQAGSLLSNLTHSASVVMTPKYQAPIKHIEFVSLNTTQALVVLVTADGNVENRMFDLPVGMTPSALREAANFLSAISAGHTIGELQNLIQNQIATHQRDLDSLSTKLIKRGLAQWSDDSPEARLIVRGRAHLIADDTSAEDLERIKILFDDLERKKEISQFLDLTEEGDGVKIFIGSENKLFSLSGSSLVVSPYMSADRKVIGAVGVIGPTRLNYGRVVPIVDYTAQLIGRMIEAENGQ